MAENCKILSEAYGAKHVAQMKLISDDVAEMEYIDGMIFEDYLCKILEEGGVDAFTEGLKFYFQNILRGTEDDLAFAEDVTNFKAPNRRYEFDLNFRNIMVRNGDFVLFDYEFLLPTLPKKFIAWRAFNVFYHNCGNFCYRQGITSENLIAALQLSPSAIDEYQNQSLAISCAIADFSDERYKKQRLPIRGFKFA